MKNIIGNVLLIALAVMFLGCSEPLTTREKGAAIGTVGGAGVGAIIGSVTGSAGAGAGIGAAIGLLGGALIGDQLQGRQKEDAELQKRIDAQQAEIDRQRKELEQLKAQQER
jgi:outer membrane lipoprotein SlyB